jgi:general secretion pathway protein A
MGKSIVLECLRDLLKAHATHFAVLLNSKISVTEFFELIAHDFRLPCASATKTATLIALNEYLLERSRAGLTTALVVDSAEKLSTQVLEEIELLGNLENRDGRLLQVVFAAQPSFERQLDAPELRGLKQRLMLRARLDPLDATQTVAYIEHRMMAAGGKNQSFLPSGVLAEIHRRAHGVPRLINALCSRLLASCRELQVKTAELSMLEGIADDFAAGASGES